MKKLSQNRIVMLLTAAVIVMTAGLGGLVAVGMYSSARLAAVDRLIVDDTAPSIVALEAATVDLGELDALTRERSAATVPRVLLDTEIAAKRRALAMDLDRYLSLPIDPGEEQVRVRLQSAEAALDRALDRVLHGSRTIELGTDFASSVSRLDAELRDAVGINAGIEEQAVSSLRAVRRMLLPGAIVLQILCIAAAGAVVGLAFRVLRNTAETATQSRRLLQEKTNELEAFAGRVAHDLLSPLMSVGLGLAAAEPYLDTPERARIHRMIQRASASLQRVRSMVTDLLDFARAGAAPPLNVSADVETTARGVADDLGPLAEETSAELCVEIETRRRARCSAGALTSVLTNLVQNAVKHLDTSPTRRVTLRACDAGNDIRFEVEDTGPGIDGAEHVRIFEPYVQGARSTSGLGLGLATVKRIAEAHGGHVGLRSTLGRGALFWVTLPAVGEKLSPAPDDPGPS
ncbi:periplasmic sensor hybrid histidine kinase [Minicystis rosea]|nr:periplasmic sensor hybrid histidine kinase [Minicystis rosea]